MIWVQNWTLSPRMLVKSRCIRKYASRPRDIQRQPPSGCGN